MYDEVRIADTEEDIKKMVIIQRESVTLFRMKSEFIGVHIAEGNLCEAGEPKSYWMTSIYVARIRIKLKRSEAFKYLRKHKTSASTRS